MSIYENAGIINSSEKPKLPHGVIFNAYPDSIGSNLGDCIDILKQPLFKDTFSTFYILPTFFNSDLDRGFSIIDYNLNKELVSATDIAYLKKLNIKLKLDMVLNHLSVNSPQFLDLQKNGEASPYRDFFIDWNKFWQGKGTADNDGCIIPEDKYLQKLFTRKPGLPVIRIDFKDGTKKFFWNTFYQETIFDKVCAEDFAALPGITPERAAEIAAAVNNAFLNKISPDQVDLGPNKEYRDQVLPVIREKRRYLGQLDLNARSAKVWEFYAETLKKLKQHGAKIIRLDAFAYLHKEAGRSNFFNRPGTWHYLEQLKKLARKEDLIVFPEIHAEYGTGIHEEIAQKGYPMYDFFFPGLIIHALEYKTANPLVHWIEEIIEKDYNTINMLGCHDGIPVLDLKGKRLEDGERPGLLNDEEVDTLVDIIVERGGLIKNLYGPGGQKVSYYQVNATFFSALGEDEDKMLLARAIQLFMPGTPQVWYLDLFAGKNDYAAVEKSGSAGHKEINRTNLSLQEIDQRLRQPVVLKQLDMIRFRNSYPAFKGTCEITEKDDPSRLKICWNMGNYKTTLSADLFSYDFEIKYTDNQGHYRLLKLS